MWIDISRRVESGMRVYPGDPPTRVQVFADDRVQGGARVSMLSMSAHAGTHLDAPCHYLAGAPGVEALSLDALIGPANVVEFETFMSQAPYYNKILLRNARPIATWPDDLPYPALLGVDGPSVGGDALHALLLKNGVALLEGLDLSAAPPGEYTLCCLPILLPGGDGAPARAVLWRNVP